MIWDKPFELTEEEYKVTYRCLNLDKVEVSHELGCVSTHRKATGEPLLLHYFPWADDLNYDEKNEKHIYYQTADIFLSDQKSPEELPRQIVLNDPAEVQRFLNEVIDLQKEREENEKGN